MTDPRQTISRETSPRKSSERPSNVTELRARIDAGRTGDRVPGIDPAAPPSGITPVPQDSIAPDTDPPQPRGNFWIVLIVSVIALAIVYLIWAARR